jgi:hypothetical protein
MRTTLRTTVIALALFVALGTTAHAAVVSATLTDPQGDGNKVSDVHPWDLASFGIEYDDSGKLTASFTVYDDERTGIWAGYGVQAEVGFWNADEGFCDSGSPGGVFFRLLPNVDAPVPNSWVTYSVVGHGDFPLVETFPEKIPSGYVFTIVDPEGFADRGYDCVRNIELRGEGHGSDNIGGTVCLSAQGAVLCPAPTERIAVRWLSPRDGQTVSGFLHEGESDCLALTTGPIVRTENWVDGSFHDAQSNAPWGCEIDTRQLANGTHTLTVKAFATDGRVAEDTIRIQVSNPTSGTAPTSGGGTSEPTRAPETPAPAVDAGPPAAPAAATPASPAGGAPPTRPDRAAPATTTRPLTTARAAVVSRHALARRYGRAFTKRTKAGYRLTCRARGPARATCRVAWRRGAWRYAGTVRVSRTRARDTAVVDVTRRRVRAGSPR